MLLYAKVDYSLHSSAYWRMQKLTAPCRPTQPARPTKMLSTIKQFWPPAPSPTQTTTGYKFKNHKIGDVPVTEELRTLDTYDWWTGLRIATMGAEPAMFHVRIVDSVGNQFGPDWIQESNMWVPFYWAIPGDLALKEELKLSIALAERNTPIEPDICVRISFHTLAEQPPHDPYFFIDDGLKVRYTWINGQLTATNQAPDNAHAINPMSVLGVN